MSVEPEAIGFIGTGTIGAPMAQRLIDAGQRLVGCEADGPARQRALRAFQIPRLASRAARSAAANSRG